WSLDDLNKQGVLVPGHTYRFYVIVHDGDQNKVGGDAGQASFTYFYPGSTTTQPASIGGHVFDDTTIHSPTAGVKVTPTGTDPNANVVSLSTTTDASGAYSFFTVSPGTYTITETPPPPQEGYFFTGATPTVGQINGNPGSGTGNGTQITTIYLGSGEPGTAYDFANFSAPFG